MIAQIALAGFSADGGRHSMSTKHQRSTSRHVGEFLNKDHAPLLEALDDPLVVNDRVADVQGRPVNLESEIDDLNGIRYAGTKAARRGEQNLLHCLLWASRELAAEQNEWVLGVLGVSWDSWVAYVP